MLISGIGRSLDGRLMMLELKDMGWSTMRISRNPAGPVCGRLYT